jgi:hypothetical protein
VDRRAGRRCRWCVRSVVRAENYVRAGRQASARCLIIIGHDRGRVGPLRLPRVSQAFAALWLLRMTDREKDVEILALRHQLAVLQRQLGDQRPRLRPEDRALLAALLVPLAGATLRGSGSWSARIRC